MRTAISSGRPWSHHVPRVSAATLKAQELSGGTPGCDPGHGELGWRCPWSVQHITGEIPKAPVQKPAHFPWERCHCCTSIYQGAYLPDRRKHLPLKRKVWKYQLQVCLCSRIPSSFRSAVAKAGGGCPPLATHPLFIKHRRLKRNHFEH